MSKLPTASEMTNALSQMGNPSSASKKVANDWYKRGDLPPEGELVKYRGEEFELIAYRSWEGDLLAILFSPLHGYTKHLEAKPDLFSPIQPERDKLVNRAIIDAIKPENQTARQMFGCLVDAGWRPIKQQTNGEFCRDSWNECGIEISEADKLYRAGCRFIEQGG